MVLVFKNGSKKNANATREFTLTLINKLLGLKSGFTFFSVNSMPAEVIFTIQHTNMSTAEAHNVSVVFYFTGFFNFSSLEYCNVSDTLQTMPKIEFDNGPQRKVKFTVSLFPNFNFLLFF